jgi:hypothetical protein
MKNRPRDPFGVRFIEGPAAHGPAGDVDQRIGQLLRQLPPPPALPPGNLARVAAHLRDDAGLRRPRRFRYALVAALVLGSSSAVYARRQIGQVLVEVGAALGIHTAAPPPTTRAQRQRHPAAVTTAAPPAATVAAPLAPPPGASATTAAAPATPVALPPPALPRSAGAAPRVRPRPTRVALVAPPASTAAIDRPAPPPESAANDAPAAPAPLPVPPPPPAAGLALAPAPLPAPATTQAPPPSPSSSPPSPSPRPWYTPAPSRAAVRPPSVLGAEARLMREALESLRLAHDPAMALARLDEHRARFPGGLLRADADLLRVDALVALDRRGEALALLESLPVPWSPRGAELQVLRGELRAAHSCQEARLDFDQVLAREAPATLAERALRGRAICRLEEGGLAAATADLEAYLVRFPDGPFAAQATKLLRRR